MLEGTLNFAGSNGYFWSSSLYTGNPDYAYNVGFYSGRVVWNGTYRFFGFTVRPVCK
jgi:hypothetical protein